MSALHYLMTTLAGENLGSLLNILFATPSPPPLSNYLPSFLTGNTSIRIPYQPQAAQAGLLPAHCDDLS